MPAARENGVWRATPLIENCGGYNQLPRSGSPRFSCSYYFLVVHQAIYFSSLSLELVEKPYLLLLKLLLVGGLPPKLVKQSVSRRCSASPDMPSRSADEHTHSMYAYALGTPSIKTSAK